MFTGIIEELGKLHGLRKSSRMIRLSVKAQKVCKDVKIGDSISVNGICLTVVEIKNDILSFDVMPETVNATILKYSSIGEILNLERALKAGDRFGGHFVTGHIDCVGIIRSKKIVRGNLEFLIGIPVKFLKYVVLKGSIAIDGISLTVAGIKSGAFCVYIIPHTARVTTLGFKNSGDRVNIELDILSKKVV